MKTFVLLIVACALLTGCTFSHGSSTDTIYGWDNGPVWGHMYLKNDHATAYCFPDYMTEIIDAAYENNFTVKVTYETYLIRGSLCRTSEKYDNVVVTHVEIIK